MGTKWGRKENSWWVGDAKDGVASYKEFRVLSSSGDGCYGAANIHVHEHDLECGLSGTSTAPLITSRAVCATSCAATCS